MNISTETSEITEIYRKYFKDKFREEEILKVEQLEESQEKKEEELEQI